MENRENAGYKIIVAVPSAKGEEIVIGYNPAALAKFVCWDYTIANDNYFNGGYTFNYRQALLVMAERIQKQYDNLMVEWKED